MGLNDVGIARIEFSVRPRSAITLSNFTGSIVMSMVLRALKDEGLAKKLHDLKMPKPISVTPFILRDKVLYGGLYAVEPGSELKARLTVVGEDLAARFLDALSNVDSVELFGVKCDFEVRQFEFRLLGELAYLRKCGLIEIEFKSPTRFARRRIGVRKSVKYDFCPCMENIIKSTLIWYKRVIGIDDISKYEARILRWVYNYVYTRDFIGRVVSTRLPGRSEPQLGFIGKARYEVRSKRESRLSQFWTLLNLAELINVGTTRSLGFGFVEVKCLG